LSSLQHFQRVLIFIGYQIIHIIHSFMKKMNEFVLNKNAFDAE
jgi:hypothetical protein